MAQLFFGGNKMQLKMWRALKQPRAGFTLIELLVVVLIIGILAAIAVPQYFKVVEKGRFAEATSCFSTIKGAQERYYLKYNSYATDDTKLDVTCAVGKAFDKPKLTGDASRYTVILARIAPLPQTYGAYTVTYEGPSGTMTCDGPAPEACKTDLLP